MPTTPIPGTEAHAAPWYTHRWPWLLMLGPASVLGGGAIAVWLALAHPDAMVVDDYYRQGKAINLDLRRDRAGAALHLRLQLRYLPAAGRLEGRVDSFGYAMVAPFTIRLAHPTLPERDMVLQVRPDPDGQFAVPLPALEKTHWRVVVEGGRGDWRLAGGWDWGRQSALLMAAGPD